MLSVIGASIWWRNKGYDNNGWPDFCIHTKLSLEVRLIELRLLRKRLNDIGTLFESFSSISKYVHEVLLKTYRKFEIRFFNTTEAIKRKLSKKYFLTMFNLSWKFNSSQSLVIWS